MSAPLSSSESLASAMTVISYVPTIFGIAFLGSADACGAAYGDERGVTGGFAGLLCLVYGLFCSSAVSRRNSSSCNVLAVARSAFTVVGALAGCGIAYSAGSYATGFVVMYISFAIFGIPEAYLLYAFAFALNQDAMSAATAGPGEVAQQQQHRQQQHWAQAGPPQGVAPPMFSGPAPQYF
mmetsp:Transcript_1357/g.2972  ORF Transcript_1357/g.2972 Transcript_1357/m.2972 type:complete len:181 (+) Transcript_1357:84-626(+)